jgi:hypothetical protein
VTGNRQGEEGDIVRLRALFTTAATGAAIAATAMAPQVSAAAQAAPLSAIKWACHYEGGGPFNYGADITIDAPGVGKTFTLSTGDGQLGQPWYGGEVTGRETSTTTLTLVSVHLSPGWTDVINQAGPPKVVVQFTNTGGGGPLPPNTYRIRSFFSIETTPRTPGAYYIVENQATCVPAT